MSTGGVSTFTGTVGDDRGVVGVDASDVASGVALGRSVGVASGVAEDGSSPVMLANTNPPANPQMSTATMAMTAQPARLTESLGAGVPFKRQLPPCVSYPC